MHKKVLRFVGKCVLGYLLLVLFLVLLLASGFLKRYRKSGGPCHDPPVEIGKLVGNARMYYLSDHWDSNGNLLPKAWPLEAKKTPARIPCGGFALAPPSTWERNGWGPLHFAVVERTMCSYEFRSKGREAKASYWARIECPRICGEDASAVEIRGWWIGRDGNVATSYRWENCNWNLERWVYDWIGALTFYLFWKPDVMEDPEPPPHVIKRRAPGAR